MKRSVYFRNKWQTDAKLSFQLSYSVQPNKFQISMTKACHWFLISTHLFRSDVKPSIFFYIVTFSWLFDIYFEKSQQRRRFRPNFPQIRLKWERCPVLVAIGSRAKINILPPKPGSTAELIVCYLSSKNEHIKTDWNPYKIVYVCKGFFN